jgi:hypothetical protein
LLIRDTEDHFFGVFKDFDFFELVVEGFDLAVGLVLVFGIAHACDRNEIIV